jgi:hypothetical protein
MKRVALVFGLVLLPSVFATRSWASDPSALTVSPTEPSTTWVGDTYSNVVDGSLDGCPAGADVDNAVCDHVILTVSVPAGYWDDHPGSVTISIGWDDPSNDFDLYLYQGDEQIAASEGQGTATELLRVPDPSGDYEVRVVPRSVLESGYLGSITLASDTITPSPTPTASPTPAPDPSPSATSGTEPSATNETTSPPPESRPAAPASSPAPPAGGPPEAATWHPAHGTHLFGPSMPTTVDREVFFQASVDGGATPTTMSPGVAVDQAIENIDATAVLKTIPRIPTTVWVLLPLGLLLLLLVTYLVLEPGADHDR